MVQLGNIRQKSSHYLANKLTDIGLATRNKKTPSISQISEKINTKDIHSVESSLSSDSIEKKKIPSKNF